ncbi:xyloglucan endotransglucosylase/hydrolase protein 2 isoform X1 [Vigna radiata var. radiata]|uniref:Xyloglucan endotransglucosylase/hydrolase n=1 Tax=Vigna radiata var. radiata TaxID=3916 RepID=A0A1S3TTA2_VIGRR|nr:xyloglucan endotransglucosylase/hydrolase protein 2 isoform X1 [Vigna radiata var. radiata]
MGSQFFIFLLLVHVLVQGKMDTETSFDENYEVIWGDDHVVFLNQRKEIQLTMDNSSGSGFGSKMAYGSGFFNMKIKVPNRNSAGVVTAYYLSSEGSKHDELDFEFLGNREGKPYRLQTNVFVDGQGNREQRIRLWFDPTADFHNYRILWNQHQIVFYVDNVPIRVFKNKTNIGVGYPSKAMKIQATLWDAESWATNGGKTKTDWLYAPFKANFQGFHVSACQVLTSNATNCSSDNFWWNRHKFWQLDPVRQTQYQRIKHKYTTYDYCTDRKRYPQIPLECL